MMHRSTVHIAILLGPIFAPTAELPIAVQVDAKWTTQGRKDAKLDRKSMPYDGLTPIRMVCDTTQRLLPDKSWIHFQYPSFAEFHGAIWFCVTQGDSDSSRKERIMFGQLE